ncbi:MAG: hypothetical protein WCD79_21890, partial [Chthoniobacteraceae bacterium]
LTHLNFPLCNSENLIIKKQKNPLSPAPNHREERFSSDLDAWTLRFKLDQAFLDRIGVVNRIIKCFLDFLAPTRFGKVFPVPEKVCSECKIP